MNRSALLLLAISLAAPCVAQESAPQPPAPLAPTIGPTGTIIAMPPGWHVVENFTANQVGTPGCGYLRVYRFKRLDEDRTMFLSESTCTKLNMKLKAALSGGEEKSSEEKR